MSAPLILPGPDLDTGLSYLLARTLRIEAARDGGGRR